MEDIKYLLNINNYRYLFWSKLQKSGVLNFGISIKLQKLLFRCNQFPIIMNKKNQNVVIKSEQGLEEETNQTKVFKQDIFKINYTNTSKIFYQEPPESQDVKINNYLCYQEDKKLHKVTEIIYQDKLIRIEDFFEVALDFQKVKKQENMLVKKKEKGNSKNIEKVRIFSKDVLHKKKSSKTDKKNIVKNIVKIFLSWLQKHSSDQHCITALDELKILLDQQNFNNRLIKKIVSNQNISKVFLEFINIDGEEQIKFSRIQDKSSHYEALKLYSSLILDYKQGQGNSLSSNSSSSVSEQQNEQKGSQVKSIDNKQFHGQKSIKTKQQRHAFPK